MKGNKKSYPLYGSLWSTVSNSNINKFQYQRITFFTLNVSLYTRTGNNETKLHFQYIGATDSLRLFSFHMKLFISGLKTYRRAYS